VIAPIGFAVTDAEVLRGPAPAFARADANVVEVVSKGAAKPAVKSFHPTNHLIKATTAIKPPPMSMRVNISFPGSMRRAYLA
jgi:hypothetical protein